MNRARILNIRWSLLGIISILLGVGVFWELHIQPYVDYDSTYGEIICVYKADKKNQLIWICMVVLSLHTGAPKVHWGFNTSCISVVESKIITPRVKKIIFLSVSYKNNFAMVLLFTNMRRLVSFRQICAPNHILDQLSVGVLHG